MLLVLGLVMVLSSSSVDSLESGKPVYAEFLKQGQFALLGVIPMLLAARLPPRFYQKIAWWGLLFGFGFQALIFTPLAQSKYGNTNWVHFGGGISVQPSEFLKIALAVWLGAVLGRKIKLLDQWKHVVIPAVPAVLLALLLVLGGNDAGTAMIFMLLAAGALFVAGAPLRIFGVAAAALLVSLAALVISSPNRTARIFAWLGINNDAAATLVDNSFQTQRGLWGLGTGGITGVGLGAGRQKWSALPAAHNDFIFSVIGEELGLLGTLCVLVLFALLGLGMVRVIRRHPSPFVKITTAAIACWIVGQALINIGVVVGLVPVIGVPLPLVSAGGSALIATMLALGIVISFARDEPGAQEMLKARTSVVRRSMAVIGNNTWRRAQRQPHRRKSKDAT